MNAVTVRGQEVTVAGVYIADESIDICLGEYTRSGDGIPTLSNARFTSAPRYRGFSEAMEELVAVLRPHRNLKSIYVGTFGPLVSIDIEKRGKHGGGYGQLQRINTHEQDWQGEALYETLAKELKRDDICIDVDVHVAARGEILHRFKSEYTRHRETSESVLSPRDFLAAQAYAFVEISNGLGCGVSQGLSPWRGRLHPEFGHSICRRPAGDTHPSACHLHDECLEGRASLRSFKSRLAAIGQKPSTILNNADAEHSRAVQSAFRMQANYIAQLCVNATTTYSPGKIIIGGDLGRSAFFLHALRSFFHAYMGGARERYFPSYPDLMDLERYIVGASRPHPSRKKPHIGALGAAFSAGLASENV